MPLPHVLLRVGAAFLVAAAVAACSDTTGPGFAITLDGRVSNQTFTEESGRPVIRCEVELEAVATGDGHATWQSGVFRWYMGVDRTAPIDSQIVSKDEVHTTWGSSVIGAGRARSKWQFWADAPFEVEIALRYTVDGAARTDTATKRLACGAVPPAAGVARPTVTDVRITPATGDLEPGDTVTVTYTAASTIGLWTTTVVISGPFDARQSFSEQQLKSRVRTVTIPVPPGARHGAALTVAVIAEDAASQYGAERVNLPVTFVDRTAPVLTSVMIAHENLNSWSQFAVGDFMRLWAAATDDNGLAWFVYEIGAPANVRDSIAIPGGLLSANPLASVKTKAEWIGSPIVSAYVRDLAGNVSNIIRSAFEAVRIYPVVTRETSPVVQLPGDVFATGGAGDAIHDERRNVMYIAQPRAHRVQVLDLAAMALRAPIVFTEAVGGIDLSAGGDSLVVVVGGRSLAFVDLTKPEAAPTMYPLSVLDTAGTDNSTPLPPRPAVVRVAANGRAYVLLEHGTRSGSNLVEVDLTTGTHRLRPDVGARGVFNNPLGRFGRTPDRSRLVFLPDITCPQSYIAATDAFTPCAALVRGAPGVMSFSTDGTRLTYGDLVLDQDLNTVFLARPASQWDRAQLILAPAGDVAYMVSMDGLTRVRLADGAFIERLTLPFLPSRVIVARDGTWLLALDAMRMVRVELP